MDQLFTRAKDTLILALSSFRVVDILDIAVVAVFIYYSILSLRRTRSRFVLLGIGAVAAVYAIARILDLGMTLGLFQLVLAVAAVGLLIIFQDEVRQTFERLGSARLMRKTPPLVPSAVREIAKSCVDLAKAKTAVMH